MGKVVKTNAPPQPVKIQRGQARAAILTAAARLFAENGFWATSIEEIARAAGVARPTVFTAAEGKPAILKAVIEIALAGDDEPIPVSQRTWFIEVIAQPDPEIMLRLHARNLRRMYERVADLYCAVEHAATSETAVAEIWAELQRQRLIGAKAVSSSLANKGPLREKMNQASVADVLWCIATPMDYRRFVNERGWSPDQYEAWLANFMIATFLPPR